ncbi:uncharacterized protein [Halyomorpha halys]|uniref:uncharacterized protein n=1 Tax=Halyomorpha halys TaxID=286706 RepID=UPI0006D4C901
MGFLEANLLTNLRLVDVVKWMLIVVGAGVCVAGVVLYRMKKEANKKTNSREDLLPPGNDDVEVLDPSRLSGSTASLVRSLVQPTAPVTHTAWDVVPSPSLQLPAIETIGASPGISSSAPLEPRARSTAEALHSRLSTGRLRKF